MSEREAAAVRTHPAFWRSSVRAIVLAMATGNVWAQATAVMGEASESDGDVERRESKSRGGRRGVLEKSPTVPAEQVLFNAVRGTCLVAVEELQLLQGDSTLPYTVGPLVVPTTSMMATRRYSLRFLHPRRCRFSFLWVDFVFFHVVSTRRMFLASPNLIGFNSVLPGPRHRQHRGHPRC